MRTGGMVMAAFVAAALASATSCEEPARAPPVARTYLSRMREYRDAMCSCQGPSCAKTVAKQMTNWARAFERSTPSTVRVHASTTRATTEAFMEMSACALRVVGREPTIGAAEAPHPPAAPGSTIVELPDMPPACRAYGAAIEKLAACNTLPAATRDALRQSYVQTTQAWSDAPAEGRAALASACTSATAAILRASAVCP